MPEHTTDPDTSSESTDFVSFAQYLRDEADWVANLHKHDPTDDASNDERILNQLADRVEQVGKKLGYM